MRVVGIDGCRGGWVAVSIGAGGFARGVFAPTLAGVAEQVPDAAGFGVDIPIGLPSDGARRADVEARAVLGPRRHSVFTTPIRAALAAPTHAQATAISTRRTGRGISRQAYGLRARIEEAEVWARDATVPVWEVHPEVSFAEVLGGPATAPKKTWTGMRERAGALTDAGVDLTAIGDAGRHAAPDDVLDAAIVAWSAARLVQGGGRSLPDPPEIDPVTGWSMAIWV